MQLFAAVGEQASDYERANDGGNGIRSECRLEISLCSDYEQMLRWRRHDNCFAKVTPAHLMKQSLTKPVLIVIQTHRK